MAVKKKNNIPVLRRAIGDAISDGVQNAAEMVAQLAGELAPVDEGDLATTPRVEPGKNKYRRRVVAGGIAGPNKIVNYAQFVEPDQPFLKPALKAIDVKTEVAASVKALLDSLT